MRDDHERLDDIRAPIEAIDAHLERGTLSDGLVYDAVRVRLIEIGEAVKDLDPALRTSASNRSRVARSIGESGMAACRDIDHRPVLQIEENDCSALGTRQRSHRSPQIDVGR